MFTSDRIQSDASTRASQSERIEPVLSDLQASPERLRGTSPSVLLAKFGHILRSSSSGPDKPDDFAKSFVVPRLDMFLSHSWHASWRLKYFTLLLYFNAAPSIIVALLVGSCVFVVHWYLVVAPACAQPSNFRRCHAWDEMHQIHNVLPIGLVAGFLCGLIALFTWHHIVVFLPGSFRKTLFLDKVCINQRDLGQKRDGILSIGGILANSEKLLVVWDETYFQRLWCVFEISAWCSMPDSPIVFLPTVYGELALTFIIGVFSVELMVFMIDQEVTETNQSEQQVYIGCYFIVALFGTVLMRRCAEEFHSLDIQLATFSIRSTKCFCCSQGHVNSATGEQLECDRQLVYDAIKIWQDAPNVEAGLNEFDTLIRTWFRTLIKNSIRRAQMPYDMALLASIIPGLARLGFHASMLDPLWFSVAEFFCWTFIYFPMVMGASMAAFRCFPCFPSAKLLKRLLETSIAAGSAGLLYFIMYVDHKVMHRADLFSAAWVFFTGSIVAALYPNRCGRTTTATKPRLPLVPSFSEASYISSFRTVTTGNSQNTCRQDEEASEEE
eukprot:TRINITY_DN3127_c1_g2_i1.p1 TRINITY_DN3127_c1_g2~~TRINITY_DN3127_c1_g2_i1.p1  ORF type:complete len:554 (-),score=60.75 TRINITY_DN3127_c1_g2_i1:188-1849(-)